MSEQEVQNPQQNLDDAISRITSDKDLKPESKEKLLRNLQLLKSPLEYDRWIYRMVVFFLGITIVATVIGGFVFSGSFGPQYEMPEGLIALGSAAIGALAGLLAPTPGGK